MQDRTERPVVIASNRGPLSFAEVDGEIVARRGGGGLVSGLAPLVEDGRARWIAAAMGPADRAAARAGHTEGDGIEVRLLDLDEEDQRLHYDVVSNSTMWFVHHGLYDQVREPAYDDAWHHAWEAYRRVNESFAAAVCEEAPPHASVLVQDYHLTLVAPAVRSERPDLRLVHFHHTPFAGPDGLRVLPPAARDEMLDGLAAHDACGFHTDDWVRNHRACQSRWRDREVTAFAATLNSDPAEMARIASSPECDTALAALEELVGDRRVIARVDRMELSKNIVRGFTAFDQLLHERPDLRGAVVFVACCYPSRLGVPAYARYRDEVEAAAAKVNESWGTPGWTPVVLLTDDDHLRSVALLRRYDVLLVNPVRDGLNLVAKEGPMVNRHDGQLVLSTEAGAFSELGGVADPVHPFDVAATARALATALDREPEERQAVARHLAEAAAARTPADWLADQLAH